jgi:hypothetical protein
MPGVKESDILKQILDYLTVEKIWHLRINTGAMFGRHKGKSWAVRFAKPGTADILCTVEDQQGILILWIECKRPKEKQSADQLAFEQEVLNAGHGYLLADSYEKVRERIAILRS